MARRLRRVALHTGTVGAPAGATEGEPLNGIPLGRVFGFPTFVEPSALLLLGLFALLGARDGPGSMVGGVLVALVVFGSVLVHELGHALVARRFRLGPIQISLNAFGGLTRFGRVPAPRQGVLVTLAGPLAGFGLATVCFCAALVVGPGRAGEILTTATSLNLFWSAFNLLPMLPLDGGIVALHGMTLWLGPKAATLWAARASVAVGGLVLATAFAFGEMFIGIFAVMSLARTLPLAFGSAAR